MREKKKLPWTFLELLAAAALALGGIMRYGWEWPPSFGAVYGVCLLALPLRRTYLLFRKDVPENPLAAWNGVPVETEWDWKELP